MTTATTATAAPAPAAAHVARRAGITLPGGSAAMDSIVNWALAPRDDDELLALEQECASRWRCAYHRAQVDAYEMTYDRVRQAQAVRIEWLAIAVVTMWQVDPSHPRVAFITRNLQRANPEELDAVAARLGAEIRGA